MKRIHKKAINLVELLIVLAVIGILVIPTIDLMSNMLIAEANYNSDVKAKQSKLSATERIVNAVREGSYIYPSGTGITVPTMSSSTSATVGNSAIAVLVPIFNSDGSVQYSSSTGETSFKCVAYSIISEAAWNGASSGKYALVETIYNTSVATDSDDILKVTGSAPTDLSSGTSNLLMDNLVPATLTNMGSSVFDIDNNVITFGLVPTARGVYFPSSAGTNSVDDTSYVTSVVVQNYR